MPCGNVFRLRDGSVAEYRSYIDITPVYACLRAPVEVYCPNRDRVAA